MIYYSIRVKHNMIRQVKHNQLTFENMVMSEGYYITNLDLWLLSLAYNVPIILISSTKLLENKKIFYQHFMIQIPIILLYVHLE